MDEEMKSLAIKQAAALEKLADAIEKLPTNMARNTSKEKSHEQNAGQIAGGSQFATDAMRSLQSDTGPFGLLKSIQHPAAQVAGAAVDAMAAGNAYQYQQKKPYEQATEFAKAAGQAGVEMSPAQSMYVRDFYRNLGQITTANVNQVDQQNSPWGSRVQKAYQAASQWFTDSVQSDAVGTIMFGSDAYYHQNSPEQLRKIDAIYAQDRALQRKEYEGK